MAKIGIFYQTNTRAPIFIQFSIKRPLFITISHTIRLFLFKNFSSVYNHIFEIYLFLCSNKITFAVGKNRSLRAYINVMGRY